MATLTQLEYLLAVDKYRHFGKAAKACQVSQPTLSMQLHKMEEEVGITFFDRSKQPILPNPDAIKIIEQARTVLREFEKLKHFTKDSSDELGGEFKLGVIPTVAPYLLPKFIGEFSTQFPKVEMSIRELTTNQILDALERDELDAGILATPLSIPSLDERPLYYEPFWVFTSDEHPIAKLKTVHEDDLTANGIWLLSEGHCLRNQVVKLCSTRKTSAVLKNVSFESGSLETLIELVKQGHGYTLIPAMATEKLKLTSPLGLKEIKSPIPTREISLVYRRSQYKHAMLKAIAQTIKAHLPDTVFQKRSPQMSVIQVKAKNES